MKYCIYIYFLCFSTQVLFSQKQLEKQFPAKDISQVIIKGNGFSAIEIISTHTPFITVGAEMDGEYFENILLQTKIELQTLTISENFSPFFIPKNDKLAAHKFISVTLYVHLPKNVAIQCQSNTASLEATGAFNDIMFSIENGSCILSNFQAKGNIQTKRGNILIETAFPDTVYCFSKYGTVKGQVSTSEKTSLVVESVYGDISLIETE